MADAVDARSGNDKKKVEVGDIWRLFCADKKYVYCRVTGRRSAHEDIFVIECLPAPNSFRIPCYYHWWFCDVDEKVIDPQEIKKVEDLFFMYELAGSPDV